MRIVIGLIVIFSIICSRNHNACAQTFPSFETGEQLISLCKADRPACETYIAGVTDNLYWTGQINVANDSRYQMSEACINANFPLSRLTDIVLEYVKNDSEKTGPAAIEIHKALKKDFECWWPGK